MGEGACTVADLKARTQAGATCGGCVPLVTQVMKYERVRTPADARRLRYPPLRQFRPDLPPWLDAVLQKALQPDPARRQEAVSEFVVDLHAPGAGFLRPRALPLAQRRPVLFWQCATLALAATVVVLLRRRAFGY